MREAADFRAPVIDIANQARIHGEQLGNSSLPLANYLHLVWSNQSKSLVVDYANKPLFGITKFA